MLENRQVAQTKEMEDIDRQLSSLSQLVKISRSNTKDMYIKKINQLLDERNFLSGRLDA